MASPEMRVAFSEHATALRDLIESAESSTQNQFELRRQFGEAEHEIAELEAAAMITVVLALDGAKSNADDRESKQTALLADDAAYVMAQAAKSEVSKVLMLAQVVHAKFMEFGRLERREMDWLIAQELRAAAELKTN